MKKIKDFMHGDTIPRNIAIIFLLVSLHFAFEFILSLLFEGDNHHDLAILSELITSAITGSKAKKAEQQANKMRPTYEIPKEIFQNQAMYESMANSARVPGQAYIENQMGQSTAQALGATQRAAGSSADALSAVSGIQQNANNMLTNLQIQAAQQQMLAKDRLAGARETTADYRQQEFDFLLAYSA
jgi:hypothetical protein